MKKTLTPVEVNTILKEVESIFLEEKALEKQIEKLQGTINQLYGRQRALGDKLYPIRERKGRLVRAADALQDDWRDWPWVKESGFAKDIPKS